SGINLFLLEQPKRFRSTESQSPRLTAGAFCWPSLEHNLPPLIPESRGLGLDTELAFTQFLLF
ncbi:MAG: hypothetical protein P8L48_00405, partial [Synechococcus sp. cluster2_bin.44]|nr:hypothetical protein [Synechococcus sp. cluster2_bin.44]